MDRFKSIFGKKEDPDNITQFVSKKEREELLLPKEVDSIFDMFADFVDEAPERNKAKFLSRFEEVEELSQTIDDILGRNKREDLKGPNKGPAFQEFMSNSKNFRNEDKEDGDFKRYHYLNKEARLNADAHGFFANPLNPFWQQDFFGPGDAQGNYSGFEEYSRGPQAGEKEEKKLSAAERGKRKGIHVVKENRMKIRKQLARIIQEELSNTLNEAEWWDKTKKSVGDWYDNLGDPYINAKIKANKEHEEKQKQRRKQKEAERIGPAVRHMQEHRILTMKELETIENSILRDAESYQEEIDQLYKDLEEENYPYPEDDWEIKDTKEKKKQSQRLAKDANDAYEILHSHGVKQAWAQEEVEEYILKEYDAKRRWYQNLNKAGPEITDEVKKAYFSYLQLNDKVFEDSEHHLTDIEGTEWQGKMKKFRDAAEVRDAAKDQFFVPYAKKGKTYLDEQRKRKLEKL